MLFLTILFVADTEDVLKQPAVLAALEKIKKDAIATATTAFIKAQQKKMVSKVVKDTKEGDDGEASGDDGSGWY